MPKGNKLTNERDIYPQDSQPDVADKKSAPLPKHRKAPADGLGWSDGFPGLGTKRNAPQEPVYQQSVKDHERVDADPATAERDGWSPVILSSRRGGPTYTEERVLCGIGVDASDWPDITVLDSSIDDAPKPGGRNEATDNEASGAFNRRRR